MVLRGIAWQQSHNRPNAKHLNANGSLDYGVMQTNQINLFHLRELARCHVNRDTLMEPCRNVHTAARHLRVHATKPGCSRSLSRAMASPISLRCKVKRTAWSRPFSSRTQMANTRDAIVSSSAFSVSNGPAFSGNRLRRCAL
ncbi:transglycosylase SLT domain-containing protein [Paraburkholderia sp. RL16-012-BIC-B]|uniref:lytic transglycosylase domain-containing protein n=1 Tax=Paraburkholderia madseniana TaxID=2599607 RepID=UPI0015589E8F|nr:transglycosylase SLT domain-containing protein [Paraburkholderia madseniana]